MSQETTAGTSGRVGHDCGPDGRRVAVEWRGMQNLFGSGLALVVLAGGFALTGDLGWLLGLGTRVIEAGHVPDDEAPVPVADPPAADPVPRATLVAGGPRRVAGPARLDLAAMLPGQRILVWLDAAAEPVLIDVIDPATAAVMLPGGPPRRAVVAGGAVVRGQPLRVMELGLARGGAVGAAQSLGDVTGIAADPAGR